MTRRTDREWPHISHTLPSYMHWGKENVKLLKRSFFSSKFILYLKFD